MSSIEEPLDEKSMQKLATIYRNSVLNYVYVCCLCECSFTNIADTLAHVESHFDDKVNITVDKNYEFVDISEVVSDTVDGNLIKTEHVDDISGIVSETVDENRVENEYASEKQLKCKVEQNYNDLQDYEEQVDELTSKEFVGNCKLCNKTFDAVTLLIIHIVSEHAGKPPFTCPQCYQSWDNKFSFFTHLQKHMDENEIAYDVLIDKLILGCKVIVKSRTTKGPLTKYEPKSQRTCDICLASFFNRKEIYRHMRKEHIQNATSTFECDKCNRKVTGRFAFYAHHYGHLTDGDAVNTLDEKVLQEKLRKFLVDNIYCDESTPDKKFGCKLCSHLTITTRKSANLHLLQRHIHYVRYNISRKYPCPNCYMSFAYASTLNVHQQIHEKEKQFSCSICKKTFAQLRYLRTHEITHSDIKSHQCTMCGSTFRTMVRLNYHMRTHLNVSSKCTICSKEVKKHRLKQHIRDVHENSHRPYSCSHCSQSFKTARTLKNHSYRHTGEKRHGCRFHHCKEMFISAAARRSHERSKHEPH